MRAIRTPLVIALVVTGCGPIVDDATDLSRFAPLDGELVEPAAEAYIAGDAKSYRVGAEYIVVAARSYEREQDDEALQDLFDELVAAESDAPGAFRTIAIGVAESLAQVDGFAPWSALSELPDAVEIEPAVPFMLVPDRGSMRVHYLRSSLALLAADSLVADPYWLGSGHVPWEEGLCEHEDEFTGFFGAQSAAFLGDACEQQVEEDDPDQSLSGVPGESPVAPFSDFDCSLGRYNSTRADDFFEALHECMESVVTGGTHPLASDDDGGGGDGGGEGDGGQQEPPEPEPVETTVTEEEDGSTTTKTVYSDGTIVSSNEKPGGGRSIRVEHPDGSETLVLPDDDSTLIMRFDAESNLISVETVEGELDSGSSIRADASDPDDSDGLALPSGPDGVPTPECLEVLEVLEQMPPEDREELLGPVINPDPTADPSVQDETFACLGGAADLQLDDYDPSCGLMVCAVGSTARASQGCECERVSATAIRGGARIVNAAACTAVRCADGGLPEASQDGTCSCFSNVVTALPSGNPLGFNPNGQ